MLSASHLSLVESASPAASAVLQHIADQLGVDADSSATVSTPRYAGAPGSPSATRSSP
jgi:hypothetical protein